MLDEACLGSCPTHVEAQEPVNAEPLREPASSESARSRAGLDKAYWSPCGLIGRNDSTVGEHHQNRTAKALGSKPFLQLIKVRTNHGHRRGVARSGDHPWILADLR